MNCSVRIEMHGHSSHGWSFPPNACWFETRKIAKMTGDESKKPTIRSMKFLRFCLKMFLVYFSVAVAIANRWTMLDIDVIGPGFKTVETRLRAAQSRFLIGYVVVYSATTVEAYYV